MNFSLHFNKYNVLPKKLYKRIKEKMTYDFYKICMKIEKSENLI